MGCCSELCIRRIPLSICVVVFVNLTVYGMAGTFVFSFLPHLVKYFGVSEINAGYWAGIVGSAVYAGRFITCFAWGHLSDRFGRKITFVLAGVTLLTTSLGFGFCRAIWTSALLRLLQGMSMGHIVVGKAIMADYCDQNNISFGISIVMAASELGHILGPSMSGVLVFPAIKFPSTFGRSAIFSTYVMLLPCLILIAGSGVGLLLTCVLTPNDKPIKLVQGSEEHSNAGFVAKHTTLLKTKLLIWSCLLYMVFSFVAVGVQEAFPLFASTALKYKGMALTEAKIGLLMFISAIIATIYQLTWLPYLDHYFGTKKTFIGCGVVFALFQPLLPVIAMVKNETVLCVLVVLVYSVLRCTLLSGYISINIFVYNSVQHHLVGSANGLAMMFAQLGRIVAPNVYGSLFAWSLRNVKVKGNLHPFGFPVNHYFVFILSCLITLVVCGCAYMLPESINSKPVEDSEGKSEERKLLPDETITDDESSTND